MSTEYVEGWFQGGSLRGGRAGTSGDRCAAVTKDSRQCGVCYNRAPGKSVVDQEKLAQGHPYWYCETYTVTGPIVCGKPAFIQRRAEIVWAWHFVVAAIAIAAVAIIIR